MEFLLLAITLIGSMLTVDEGWFKRKNKDDEIDTITDE